ncbi:hypothetical protein SERLA73DRAFT_184073 [Serpula lacrymans var. lacrymans S7.3]|uniref:Uncharacterized protein n=1 Tax=Serpula lacrymans var. lacrymans (strain S7.3) TaxID=936435 RepID=F8Q2H1_SERL3|nr:hypothetical protein SERLA73DRAFT_184073 [Serpula lacrymans var. lacrymans S7.3]
MASWVDLFSLLATTLFFVGVIVGVVLLGRQISNAVQSTKESLNNRGIAISDKGVSVKTNKRFDRSDYVDATQRGLMKALGSSTFGSSLGEDEAKKNTLRSKSATSLTEGKSHRKSSNASVTTNGSAEERERRRIFGMRKSHSSTGK